MQDRRKRQAATPRPINAPSGDGSLRGMGDRSGLVVLSVPSSPVSPAKPARGGTSDDRRFFAFFRFQSCFTADAPVDWIEEDVAVVSAALGVSSPRMPSWRIGDIEDRADTFRFVLLTGLRARSRSTGEVEKTTAGKCIRIAVDGSLFFYPVCGKKNLAKVNIMSIPLEKIRKCIADEKALTARVMRFARQASLEQPNTPCWAPETITQSSGKIIREQAEWNFNRMSALEEAQEHGYFYRADVSSNLRTNGNNPIRYLVTKARVPGGSISDDNWIVLSWTAPITAKLMGRPVGERFTFAAPGRQSWEGKILEYAKLGSVLPVLTDSTFGLPCGEYYIANERLLEDRIPSGSRGQKTDKSPAAVAFGLSEIIELADVTQREAMHLPFHESVLIEGPPGSGKTSIGLMRIPCLIDRQWEELGRDPRKDTPFHRHSTMRVLVMNQEMIPYLQSLVDSVRISGIGVETISAFLKQICSITGFMSGNRIDESQDLATVKNDLSMLNLYWKSFQKVNVARWKSQRPIYHDYLTNIHDSEGNHLLDTFDRWTTILSKCENPDRFPDINLAAHLSSWWNDARQRYKASQGLFARIWNRSSKISQDQLNELAQNAKKIAAQFFVRLPVVREITRLPEFKLLCGKLATQRSSEDLSGEWLAQVDRQKSTLSDSDLVINGWLANRLLLVDHNQEKPFIGNHRPRLTHVLIDEAQDISPNHVRVIRGMLASGGTMTLVGDLRQRLSTRGNFRNWSSLGLDPVVRAVFSVNHRQSAELGGFLSGLHEILFDERPKWKPGRRICKYRPKLRWMNCPDQLGELVAQEAKSWRKEISQATVGVLFPGKRWRGFEKFVDFLKAEMAEAFTDVRDATLPGRTAELEQINCVTVATVFSTKGLEFDVVIIIDPHQYWTGSIRDWSEIRRNVLYVAASRARHGLSIVANQGASIFSSPKLSRYLR